MPFTDSLPYSRIRVVDNLVVSSGFVPLDADGAIVSDLFREQFAHVLESISSSLASVGADLTDVVQTRCYLSDASMFGEFNELYRAAFPEPFPTRTTIVTGMAMPGIQLEIELLAELPDRKGSE